MRLVTMFCPSAAIGAEELVVQTVDEPRFVVDCKVYPVKSNPALLVGQVKMRSAPERASVSWGAGNEMLNTVPLPELPPKAAVPYRTLPDKIKPACGPAPSLPRVKLSRLKKPVPSVLRANTVPLPEAPPISSVPYRVWPARINPARGSPPSLLNP